jgi:hypothetical protein
MQESTGNRQTDALGLADRGELGLAVAVNHHGLPQPLFEDGVLLTDGRELAGEFFLAGSAGGTIDSQGDRIGFPIDALTTDVATLGVEGDVAMPAVKDEEGTGDARGDGYHAHGGGSCQ